MCSRYSLINLGLQHSVSYNGAATERWILQWLHHKTDSASYKLSIQKKTDIMQIMTKNITIFLYLIFHHREIVRLDHFMTLSMSYANTVL
jgi:hypothetical protein